MPERGSVLCTVVDATGTETEVILAAADYAFVHEGGVDGGDDGVRVTPVVYEGTNGSRTGDGSDGVGPESHGR